jgi:ABC-type transport system involved in cytochrome c biogenesis ATPase subunit
MNNLILTNLIIGRSVEMPLNMCIDYQFFAGNIYYISGNNGSGKTTFMRTVCGYLPPLSGNISIKKPLETTAYYGHDTALKDKMRVTEYLNFCVHLFDNTHGFSELVSIFNLNPLLSMPISYLSCGQKKRVSLVGLLLCSRDIYCFDEASSGLDKDYRDIFYSYLVDLVHNKNKIILFSDHTNPHLDNQKTVYLHDFRIKNHH